MNKKIPVRRCIGCGLMKPKTEMFRMVKTMEGSILPDRTGKMNGRGSYLCQSKDCLQKAVKGKGLERSFKMSIPADVYDNLVKEFTRIETE